MQIVDWLDAMDETHDDETCRFELAEKLSKALHRFMMMDGGFFHQCLLRHHIPSGD